MHRNKVDEAETQLHRLEAGKPLELTSPHSFSLQIDGHDFYAI